MPIFKQDTLPLTALGAAQFAPTYLPIPKNIVQLVPYRFECRIGRRNLAFLVDWNDQGHFWTLEVMNSVTGVSVKRKLDYAVDCIGRYQWIPEFHGLHIVPFDMQLKWLDVGITKDNFALDVKCYYATEIGGVARR